MPKPLANEKRYISAATTKIKNSGSLRELFFKIHKYEPTREELQQLRNRLNPKRSNPGTDLLGLCIENLPQLHHMTLKEFFDIESNPKIENYSNDG